MSHDKALLFFDETPDSPSLVSPHPYRGAVRVDLGKVKRVGNR